jgi:hypothetical protein
MKGMRCHFAASFIAWRSANYRMISLWYRHAATGAAFVSHTWRAYRTKSSMRIMHINIPQWEMRVQRDYTLRNTHAAIGTARGYILNATHEDGPSLGRS